jgi:hypothetical protein
MKVAELTEEQILRLYQLFREMKFAPPDGAVSNIGFRNFVENIVQLIKDFIVFVAGRRV